MSIDGTIGLMQDFLQHHATLAPFVFILIHIGLAMCMLPCSPLTFAAGVLWGTAGGLAISILAALLSSFMTFWLARRFFRTRVHAFLRRRFPAVDRILDATERHGLKFVAAVQLNPALPASTFGYLFGLTNIGFPLYAGASLLFMLPLQLLLVAGGGSLGPLFLEGRYGALVAGGLVLVALYFSYRALTGRFSRRLGSQSDE